MRTDTLDTFWGHLEELARRLKVVLFTLVMSTVSLLIIPANLNFLQNIDDYEPWISVFLRSIRERVLPPEVKLIAIGIMDPIELYVTGSFIISVGITLPVLAYEVYKFVDPALYPNERKEVYPFVASVSTLFISGALFGFFVLFPFFVWSMFPFFTVVGAELVFSIMDFYSLLFLTVVSTAAIFTFPAFFVLLVKLGIIHTDTFRQNRKYLYIGLIGLAMLISPGSSPLGNLFLFVPMAILFEIGLFFGKRHEKKKTKHQPPLLYQNPQIERRS